MKVSELNEARAWKSLGHVMDPEIPVISVVDLGIINSISLDDGAVSVSMTPTYVACVATKIMQHDISQKLLSEGFESVDVSIKRNPGWTSDRMTANGRLKLLEYGIAPPPDSEARNALPQCPQCRSTQTEMISPFGSSACKSLYKCEACGEPFERFKCK